MEQPAAKRFGAESLWVVRLLNGAAVVSCAACVALIHSSQMPTQMLVPWFVVGEVLIIGLLTYIQLGLAKNQPKPLVLALMQGLGSLILIFVSVQLLTQGQLVRTFKVPVLWTVAVAALVYVSVSARMYVARWESGSAMRLVSGVVCTWVGMWLAVVAMTSGPGIVEPRIGWNERTIPDRLLTINTLQKRYAAAHPKKGFSCDLSNLKSDEPVDEWRSGRDLLILNEFLQTSVQAGYRFTLTPCSAEANGVIAHFQVTAVPTLPKESGIRSFCTDESGFIWYDESGSPTGCLLRQRRVLR